MRVNAISGSSNGYFSKPKSTRLVSGVRRCLTCREEFQSAHQFNRVCKRCKKTDEYQHGGWMV